MELKHLYLYVISLYTSRFTVSDDKTSFYYGVTLFLLLPLQGPSVSYSYNSRKMREQCRLTKQVVSDGLYRLALIAALSLGFCTHAWNNSRDGSDVSEGRWRERVYFQMKFQHHINFNFVLKPWGLLRPSLYFCCYLHT